MAGHQLAGALINNRRLDEPWRMMGADFADIVLFGVHQLRRISSSATYQPAGHFLSKNSKL